MTESEFDLLESTFGVTLPVIYRQFALSLLPPDEETDRWECADVAELIRENRALREEGWYGLPWPAHFFCIGAHDGNHFFIDLTDPSKGVFYANHEEQFDPEDLSALPRGSLEEYCAPSPASSPLPAPAPLACAWVAGMSRGTLTVSPLVNFSLEALEAEVRRLDGSAHVEVALGRGPQYFPLMPAALSIAGGRRGYFIEAAVGEDTFHFFDPGASSKPLKLFPVDPKLKLPGQSVCHDLNLVLEALRHFYNTGGELLPTVQWIVKTGA